MPRTVGISGVGQRSASLVALCLMVGACQSDGGGVGTVTGAVTVVGGPSASPGFQPPSTEEPQPGQRVVIEDRDHHRTTTTSDSTGHYKVSLPEGDYTLMCSRIQTFTVVAGQTITLDCLLAA